MRLFPASATRVTLGFSGILAILEVHPGCHVCIPCTEMLRGTLISFMIISRFSFKAGYPWESQSLSPMCRCSDFANGQKARKHLRPDVRLLTKRGVAQMSNHSDSFKKYWRLQLPIKCGDCRRCGQSPMACVWTQLGGFSFTDGGALFVCHWLCWYGTHLIALSTIPLTVLSPDNLHVIHDGTSFYNTFS